MRGDGPTGEEGGVYAKSVHPSRYAPRVFVTDDGNDYRGSRVYEWVERKNRRCTRA